MLMRSSLATLLTISTVIGAAHGQSASGSSSADTLASSSLFDQKLKDDTFAKAPTNIKSDSLTINAKDRVFVYKGNVEVTQGDMMLVSKTLEGFYTESNQIQKLIAKGDVVITKQDIKATSQQAIYEAQSGVVTLTDNPQLQQKESILIADRIKVFLNENRSQAEGSVRVTVVNDKEKDKDASAAKKKEAETAASKPGETSPMAAAETTPQAAS